jgi:hypothetical protein
LFEKKLFEKTKRQLRITELIFFGHGPCHAPRPQAPRPISSSFPMSQCKSYPSSALPQCAHHPPDSFKSFEYLILNNTNRDTSALGILPGLISGLVGAGPWLSGPHCGPRIRRVLPKHPSPYFCRHCCLLIAMVAFQVSREERGAMR